MSDKWETAFENSTWAELVGLIRHLSECESGLARQLETALNKNVELRAEVERLRKSGSDLLEVIDAHEVESLDCDRRGDHTCECLSNSVKAFRHTLGES